MRRLLPLAAVAASLAAAPARAQHADLTTWTVTGDAFVTPTTLSLTTATSERCGPYACSTFVSPSFRTSGGTLSLDVRFNMTVPSDANVLAGRIILWRVGDPPSPVWLEFVAWHLALVGGHLVGVPNDYPGTLHATRDLPAGEWLVMGRAFKDPNNPVDASLTIADVILPAAPVVTPEPATVGLLAAGLVGLGVAGRRRARPA